MSDSPPARALEGIRICDFTGQLAGAGATKWLAAFGAEVIRIEDPVNEGRWDILRGMAPFIDERRGVDFGGGFNNHNVEKRGITLNLRTQRGKELLAEIVKHSDVVAENFAAGVLERWGFGWKRLRELRPDVIYVSNCGFGHTGPYREFKTWGPIVQALSGLTFTSGLPGEEPAGWGYSYMDHTGAMYQALAILFALVHRQRTGEGQWVDVACTEAGLTLNGPAILDWTANGRPLRREGQPNGNRSAWPPMAPHGVFPSQGEDEWVSIACRSDEDWRILADVIDEDWAREPRWRELAGRIEGEGELEASLCEWTARHEKFELQRRLQAARVPSAAVQRPAERIDHDPGTSEWGLWPEVVHSKMGRVRVDGLPVHFSKTDWQISRGGPCVGEHTDEVLRELLGLDDVEIARLHDEGVV
ncbi:MAG: CoA transferase [Deltaproteobacteria bacterium]|jgi:crotonobetainyl-CoA:carnitine CoA-transferase CaiB-like acyl-CoA transferase|nr:CoA transferase [Deltaproteobacteria bacterium]MBW2500096.1 CoA transferase [Deltaproteobacteria bacterium]